MRMRRWNRQAHTNKTDSADQCGIPISVPSKVPGADFEALLFPSWEISGGMQERDAQAIAVNHLRSVTERVASTRIVRHASAAEAEINGELAPGQMIETVLVKGAVTLTTTDESFAVTDQYLRELRDERVRVDRMSFRLEAQLEWFERQDMAWVWLFDQRPEKLKAIGPSQFEDFMRRFRDARAKQKESESCNGDSFARILVDFVQGADPAKHYLMVEMFRAYLENFGKTELSERLDRIPPPSHECEDVSEDKESLVDDKVSGDS